MSPRARWVALLAPVAAICACADDGGEIDTGPIEIIRDTGGVVHVYAGNDEDAWFGAGYVTAADRLYQMETLRRFAHGRLSEILGDAGLERDLQARTFDLPRWGRADRAATEAADPERARLITAWVAGINRRIDEILAGEAPRPFGFGPAGHDFLPERWTGDDPYIVLKGANFALDKTVEFEIAVSLFTMLYPTQVDAVQIFRPVHPVFGVPPEDRPIPTPPPAKANAHSGLLTGPLRSGVRGPGTNVRAARSPMARVGTPSAGDRRPPGAVDSDRQLTDTPELRAALRRLKRAFSAWPRPQGSNNWSIDGRFTETGRPLIANDPHLGFDFFGSPYPLHVNSRDRGGTYDVAGFAYPGTPGIALGHNRHVMWAVTSAFGDVNDIWTVEENGDSVNIGGESVPIAHRDETIIVREPGGPAGEGRSEIRTYEDVEGFGVILPDELIGIPLGGPYLMSWTGFSGRPARWFMELNRVGDLEEFEAAALRMREMNYNFMAADRTGIAYRVGLDVPDRPNVSGDCAPYAAMKGEKAACLWTGEMLPADELPHSRAEAQGYICTANNDPFGFTADGRVDNDPWFYGSFFAPGYRAKRITDEVARLTARGNVTLDEMMTVQLDLHSTMADDLLPLLAAAHSRVPTDEALAGFRDNADLDRVVTLLTEEWNREMARPEAGALVFNAYLHILAEKAIEDDIPLAYDTAKDLLAIIVLKIAAQVVMGQYPDGDQLLTEGADHVLLDTAADVAEWLKTRFGSVDPAGYSYQDIKVTRFDHAYGYGLPLFDRPSDGGEDTINVSQNMKFTPEAELWYTTYGPVERSVGTFAADGTPEAWVTFPLGAAADPDSAETAAAVNDFIEGNHRKLLFRRAEVDAAMAERFELTVPRE